MPTCIGLPTTSYLVTRDHCMESQVLLPEAKPECTNPTDLIGKAYMYEAFLHGAQA